MPARSRAVRREHGRSAWLASRGTMVAMRRFSVSRFWDVVTRYDATEIAGEMIRDGLFVRMDGYFGLCRIDSVDQTQAGGSYGWHQQQEEERGSHGRFFRKGPTPRSAVGPCCRG